MNEKRNIAIITTLSIAMIAATTQITTIVYAGKDSKSKTWIGEGSAASGTCFKPDGCRNLKDITGDNINKFHRDFCRENTADGKCKQEK
jgi:hypothetical protein